MPTTIYISTVHGQCTLCDGYDTTIDDGLLKGFSDKYGLDPDETGVFDNCASMALIVDSIPPTECYNTDILGYAYCGCETPTPVACATGYDGELIDLDKTLSGVEWLGLSTDSCREMVALSSPVEEGDINAKDHNDSYYAPFEDYCAIVRSLCGAGEETCTICPNGLANPDHILDLYHEGDDGEEDDDGAGMTCAEGHAFTHSIAHDDEQCDSFKQYIASSGCVCKTKATKAPKATKGSKLSKAPKASKAPKGSKSSKAPKVSKAPKASKAPNASKAPMASKAPKANKGN